MYRIFSTLISLTAAAVFLLPLMCIYGACIFRSLRRTLWYAVFSFYLAAVLCLVGFPDITCLTVDFTVNAVPLAGLAADFSNACLNILLFIPLGAFLPLLWEQFRNLKSTAAAGLCASAFIELAQIFTLRTTDVNDLITNTLGTLVGFWAVRVLTKGFARFAPAGGQRRDLYLVCGTVIAVMFLLQPLTGSLLWNLVLELPLWPTLS